MNQLIVFRIYLVRAAIAVRSVEGRSFLRLGRFFRVLPFGSIRIHPHKAHMAVGRINQKPFAVWTIIVPFAPVLQCAFCKYEFPGPDNLESYRGLVVAGLSKETDAENAYS